MAEKKKIDPKAKVRNRPSPVFDSKHPKVTDNKDHFPLSSENQARNALARANQYKKAPKWWKGSLQELINAVVRAVHKKYKGIEISKDSKIPGKKKASAEIPPNFIPVLESMIKLKGTNEEQYKTALAALEDKVEDGINHNGWTPIQLERLLEELD